METSERKRVNCVLNTLGVNSLMLGGLQILLKDFHFYGYKHLIETVYTYNFLYQCF